MGRNLHTIDDAGLSQASSPTLNGNVTPVSDLHEAAGRGYPIELTCLNSRLFNADLAGADPRP
jgi:hypothetical protein